MATSATAIHRSDQQPIKFPAVEPSSSPLPSATSKKPSISPLTAITKSSLKTSRDLAMHDSDAEQVVDAGNRGKRRISAVNEFQDDRSSSLSDPEDDQDEDDMSDGLKERADASNELSAHQQLEIDSEAETERLEQTPNKMRKHSSGIEKTPSKLAQASVADDDLSDPPSPLPIGPGAASSTSTNATTGQKRKRSDSVDSSLTSAASDLGESPPKRSYESSANGITAEDDAITNAEQAEDDFDRSADATDANAAPSTKGFKGRRGKAKGKVKRGVVKESESEEPESAPRLEDEQTEEDPAKIAEELKHKDEASASYDGLAKQFAAFREKLNAQRLDAVMAELELLNNPTGQHPDYVQQVACIDARLTRQANEISAWYSYKLLTLRKSTLAERSQLFSQHFQSVREQREDVLYKLGEDWYNIQKERRKSAQEDDQTYIFKFPTKKSEQIRQQAKYNHEVSVLSGVAKYVGFPAAPEIKGPDMEAAEEDLKAMRISKRPQQGPRQAQGGYITQQPTFGQRQFERQNERQNERLAHDQFIEQTPWARPQGPIPNHGTPNLTHTPDWAAEPNKYVMRQISGGIPPGSSPYTTPVPQRRQPIDDSSSGTLVVNSDPVEPPSSIVVAPPTMERLSHTHPGLQEQGSPLNVSKPRPNGTELTGFRNFSNISGTSTIDAPLDASTAANLPPAAERDRPVLPGLPTDASAPQQVFDTSALHDRKRQQDVYPNASFRPHEGAFGTPVQSVTANRPS